MRNFSARETEWLEELDGIELASFWSRAIAFVIDWIIVCVVLSALVTAVGAGYAEYSHKRGGSMDGARTMIPGLEQGEKVLIPLAGGAKLRLFHPNEQSRDGEAFKIVNNVLVSVLYFGILLWKGRGQTPGKRLMRIRVVSIVHRHLSFWHSVERALGYGAAALEAGFGFIQFFIHPYRRCAQDRLAETIVVTERGYQGMKHKWEHPLSPTTNAHGDTTI